MIGGQIALIFLTYQWVVFRMVPSLNRFGTLQQPKLATFVGVGRLTTRSGCRGGSGGTRQDGRESRGSRAAAGPAKTNVQGDVHFCT